LDAYLWSKVDGRPIVGSPRRMADIPVQTALAVELSKDLRRRGFRFVGSVIVYAYLQSVGVVDDHLVGCFRHVESSTPHGPPLG
jgi:DNA-3-methyladenine glycosylase I